MDYGTLDDILDAQSANATLCGTALKAAAQALLDVRAPAGAVYWAADAAAERIIGAASMLSDSVRPTVDTTFGLSGAENCVVVSGYVVGAVGIAGAAQAARRLGAAHVHAAILGGWGSPIAGVDAIHALDIRKAHAA